MTDVFTLNRREHARKEASFEARVTVGEASTHCTIEDISAGGAQIVAPLDLSQGREVILHLDRFGEVQSTVAWCRRGRLGLKFNEDPAVMAEMVLSIAMHGH